MTQPGFPDHLATVIAAYKAALPTTYVADELPAAASLEARLPIVLIQDVPGGAADIPWQAATGPLSDEFSFDIYALDVSREKVRDLARRLRGITWSLLWNTSVGVRNIVEESGFSRVPDWNPRVKREHAEYTFRIRRH